MRRREASINDAPMDVSERRLFGPRTEAEQGADFPLQ
jgi:nuclear transport factor 2 (NTF2) superfamily protein